MRPSPPPPAAPATRAAAPAQPERKPEPRPAARPAPFSAVIPEERKSRGIWIWVVLVLLIAGGAAAYFLIPRPAVQPQTAAPVAAGAEHQLQIDEHMKRAEDAFSQGNYDLAIEEFKAVQQLNPGSVRAKEGIERATKAKAAESVILPGGKAAP